MLFTPIRADTNVGVKGFRIFRALLSQVSQSFPARSSFKDGLFFSKDTFCEIFRPSLKRVIDLVHDHVVIAKIHCCGKMENLPDERIALGATMQEEGNAEGEVFKAVTGEFGDFWFRQVEGKRYHLWFEAEGYVAREIADIDATTADVNIGRVGMYKMIPLG